MCSARIFAPKYSRASAKYGVATADGGDAIEPEGGRDEDDMGRCDCLGV